ncbi:MAG: folate family ECF transporter S component [Oscillospiraceae bacterium]
MKGFFSVFTDSAKELKSAKCLAMAGLMTALFIILDMFSFKIGAFLKINVAFFAIAVVGMFFGPVPATLAAIAGDLIGCLVSGQAPFPLLTVTAALEGLTFGLCLYKKEGTKLVIMAVVARLIDSFVINLLLNTAILMSAGFMSNTKEQFFVRLTAISLQAVVYCILCAVLLPTVQAVYKRVIGKNHKTAA